MNKIIEELVKQSVERVQYNYRGDDTIDTEFVFNKEKFAELIVNECIRCCEEVLIIQKHYLKYHLDMELGADQCIEVIKNHFELT